MNSNAWLAVVLVALALILPLSALRSRQLPFSKIVKLGAAWLAIFLVAVFIVSQIRPS